MPEHPRLHPAQRRELFQLGAALCQTETVGGQRAYRLADCIEPACAVRLVGAEHDVVRVGFLDIGGEGGIDIGVAAALVKIGCAEEVQDLVGKGGRGLRLAIGVGVGFVQAAVLIVKGRSVIGIVGHRERGAADGQVEQKRDLPRSVDRQTAVCSQRLAQGVHLLKKGGAFLRVFTALDG